MENSQFVSSSAWIKMESVKNVPFKIAIAHRQTVYLQNASFEKNYSKMFLRIRIKDKIMLES